MKKRIRPMASFTLSIDAIDRLETIAKRSGQSKSAVIEMLIRSASVPKK